MDDNVKKDDKEDLVVEIKEFFDLVATNDSENREGWLDDIKFYSGQQWPDQLKRMRESDPNGPRPCLTINKLPLHVRQITNDVRQNKPAIKVHPVDDKGDVKMAEVLNGVIKHIEYQSDADIAYENANFYQVVAGVGYWQVITEVLDETTNQQDIFVKPVSNIFTVYYDPNCECPFGSDAERVLITSEMPLEEFEEKYPDVETSSLDSASIGDRHNDWSDDGTVRIGMYWYKEEKKTNVLLVEDMMGGLTPIPEAEYWKQYQGDVNRPKVRSSRPKIEEKVFWVKTNGSVILERGEWLGKYIPIVRVPGEVLDIEGKKTFRGVVNNAKDPCRMYNYWVSAETEMIALQPKAPFIGAAGTFDGYEDKWAMANVSNLPYLEYNPIDVNGNPVPPPQRQPFSGSPNGVVNAKMGAADDIKATTGQYDASLGMRSNETSGKAIMARQREGDTGTFHYMDNMGKAIRLTGRIIIDLIPKIYDTERIVRIVGEDGAVDQARFDPNQQEPVRKVRTLDGIKSIYNPTIGKYDVTVSIGPSYSTKRAEAFDAMTQLVQGNPQLWPVIGDLIVKNMDWPGAEAMAKRLKAMLPPQIANLEQADEGELPVEAQTQINQIQGQLQQYQQGIHDAVTAIQQKDAEIQQLQQQLEAKNMEAAQKAQEAARTAELKQMELGIKEKELAIKDRELDIEYITQVVVPGQAVEASSNDSAQVMQLIADTNQMLAALMGHISQPKVPVRKQARAVKQPDGSWAMESIEGEANG